MNSTGRAIFKAMRKEVKGVSTSSSEAGEQESGLICCAGELQVWLSMVDA
jgi:hypothetical protein